MNKKTAFQNMKLGKATKEELEILIQWSENELKQWYQFIKECKERLKKIKNPN